MKKTILFLANGFGIESKTTTYEIGDITPNIVKANNDYLATTLLSSGKEVTFSASVSADFQSAYRAFSTTGKIITAEKQIDNAIADKTFVNEGIKESINFAVSNKSKLHVFFTIGNKISYTSLEHLKEYVLAANAANVKEICIHLIIGINSDAVVRSAPDIIKSMYRIMENAKNWSITSVCGLRTIDDRATVEALAKYYRMMTTTVAEVWTDPIEVLNIRHKNQIREEDTQGFLSTRRLVYEDNDSIFIMNYEHLAIERYLSVLTYPDKVFSHGFLPKNLRISSLFPISSNARLSSAYNYALPEVYFTKLLANYDKKISIIADNKRSPYIRDILNGYQEQSPILEFTELEIGEDAFKELTSTLLNEINSGTNELIIADYNLLDKYKPNDVDTIISNLKKLDDSLGVILADCLAKENTLIFTSLYGIKEEVQIEHIKYLLNFSEKVSFIMVDKVKSQNTAFISGTTINDLSSTVFNHLGISGFKSFIIPKGRTSKSKNNLVYLILIGIIILMLIMLFFR